MNNGVSSSRRFLEGDSEAFEQIMITYRQGLIFFIDSFVHDSMVAEDIARMRVFLNAVKVSGELKSSLYHLRLNSPKTAVEFSELKEKNISVSIGM